MSTVKSFFKENRYAIIVTILALLFGLINFVQYKGALTLQKKLEVAEHNVQAAKDTLRETVTRSGKREANTLAFWTNKTSGLEKLNSDLAKEVKDTKGTVSSLIKANIEIRNSKTIPLETKTQIVYAKDSTDSIIKVPFSFEKNYSAGNFRKIVGSTSYGTKTKITSGQLDEDILQMSFVTGIKNLDKGHPEIFLRSDYPGFKVDSLKGAVLDPKLFQPKNKQKLITVGLNIGWTPFTYDFLKQKAEFNPSRIGMSAGLNFNLSRLLGK